MPTFAASKNKPITQPLKFLDHGQKNQDDLQTRKQVQF